MTSRICRQTCYDTSVFEFHLSLSLDDGGGHTSGIDMMGLGMMRSNIIGHGTTWRTTIVPRRVQNIEVLAGYHRVFSYDIGSGAVTAMEHDSGGYFQKNSSPWIDETIWGREFATGSIFCWENVDKHPCRSIIDVMPSL